MTTQAKQVLLVDDEERLLKAIAQRLEMLGFTPHTAMNGLAAIDIALKTPIDLAIVDLQMPDMNGLVTITKLKEIQPGLKTVLLTGHGNDKVKQATESLNTLYFEKEEMGDFWRFIKNLDTAGKVVVIRPGNTAKPADPSGAGSTIEIHSQKDFTENSAVGAQPTKTPHPSPSHTPRKLFGETPAMLDLRRNIERVAPIDCPVTVWGESGTGKELVAQIIHSRSRQHNRRFLTVDCENLKSEHFVRHLLGFGSADFQEAILSGRGMFGADAVGTLFFDQVDRMPMAIQEQLASLVDDIDRTMVGAGNQQPIDIRILAAAEVDLAEKVAGGHFDEKLFDQLTFFKFYIPPLRERKDDIPPLCSFFLRQFRDEFNKPVETIEPEVVQTLAAYDFPGNVRELAHIIERAVILADGRTIEKKHLPERFQDASPTATTSREKFLTLSALEQQYILEVLEANDGNKSKTAETLGISRAALWRKLKQINAKASAS